MTENVQIANTILAQIGGRRFIAMTGAKSFTAGDRALTFRLPSRFAKNGINCVRINLTPADDYTMTFMAVRGFTFKTVEVKEGVYCDGLEDAFGEACGLATTL